MCAVSHCAVLQVPAAVVMILRFLKVVLVEGVAATRIRGEEGTSEEDHSFRSDAKAEGEKVVIGGWCTADSKERGKCCWYALELDRKVAP